VEGEAKADANVGEEDGEEEVLYHCLGVVEGLCVEFFCCRPGSRRRGGSGRGFEKEKKEKER
jgi:hypothetical protein